MLMNPLWIPLLWLAGLCACVALGLALVQYRRFQQFRLQLDERLAELALRQREIATRITRLESLAKQPAPESESQGPRSGSGENSRRLPPLATSEGRGEIITAPAPSLIAIPDLATEGQDGVDQASSELGQRYGEIWALAESGASPESIARETGQPIGQVELILGLYRKVQANRIPAYHERQV
jgi:hypothetical protein